MVMKRLKRKAGKGVNVFISRFWSHDLCKQSKGGKAAYTTSTTSSSPSADTVKRTSLPIKGMPYTCWGLS